MSLSYILAFKKNCLIYLFQALIIRETFKKKKKDFGHQSC